MASTAAGKLVCPLCPQQFTAHLHFNLTTWLKHIQLFHAHQAGFRIACGIHACQRTYTNFGTFRNHVYAMHQHQANPTSTFDSPSGCTVGVDGYPGASETGMDGYQGAGLDEYQGACELGADINQEAGITVDTVVDDSDMLQGSSALFLMGLKEKHKLTQVAVQSLIESMTSLNQQRLHFLFARVSDV